MLGNSNSVGDSIKPGGIPSLYVHVCCLDGCRIPGSEVYLLGGECHDFSHHKGSDCVSVWLRYVTSNRENMPISAKTVQGFVQDSAASGLRIFWHFYCFVFSLFSLFARSCSFGRHDLSFLRRHALLLPHSRFVD